MSMMIIMNDDNVLGPFNGVQVIKVNKRKKNSIKLWTIEHHLKTKNSPK